MPSRLRPNRHKKKVLVGPPASRLKGNLILDTGCTEKHFNAHIRTHLQIHPTCNGIIIFDPSSYTKWGAAVTCKLKCSHNCGYLTPPLDFFKKVKHTTQGKGRRAGRRAAKINIQLQVGLSKQPVNNSGVRQLLMACDINPPSVSGMQKTSNKVADSFIDLNQKQLQNNRKTVKQIMNMRGVKDGIIAQTDTAFNNPPKGRAFYQPGTQAWSPLFCAEPGLDHIPLSFQTRSKLCSCLVNKHKQGCKQDFSKDQPMGNVEFVFGVASGEEVSDPHSNDTSDSSVAVKELVTDGDSHAFKGFSQTMMTNKKVKCIKGDCTRHLTRSIGRNITKARLGSLEGGTVQQTAQNKRLLANFIERRCSWEFRKAYAKYGHDIQKLKSTCARLKTGIIRCIQGDAEGCRRVSLVCGAHRRKGQTKVPYIDLDMFSYTFQFFF